MKILQLSKYYPPTHGGLELVAEFFSRSSIDLGHQVTVLSLGEKSCSYNGQFGETVIQCKEDIKLSSSPFSFEYLRQFKKIVKNSAPDFLFVHLPHPFTHELVKWFGDELKYAKTKVVGIYHSDIINQVLLRDAYNLHFCQHLDSYDYFISASPNLKHSSAILSHLPDSRVKIIPFCVDHKLVGTVPQRPASFQGKFLTIGRMVPYKGYEFLIRTFNKLPYQLTIVGGGPLKDHLKSISGPNIKFAGSITEDEKFKLLAEHDALIMSSINRAEAYGMTIVEAFSVGIPVIAADIDTGVSFLVRHGVTGLKFPIMDEASLISRIEMMKEHPSMVNDISRNCLEFFNSELNYRAFKNNLNRFYETA